MRILHTDPVVVPSGQLVVGDPIVGIHDAEPLARSFPPGRYGVRLVATGELEGVLASLVRFGPGQAVRWEPAEPARHAVDSGTSGLMDYELAQRLEGKSEEWFERHVNRCDDALANSEEPWANRRLDRETGGNLILFRTISGDGDYASFFGYSETGDVVCLFTDFWLEADAREIIVTARP